MTTIEDDFIYDTRIRDRMLAKGEISQEEVDKRLAALQDAEPQSEFIELDQPGVANKAQSEGASGQ